MSSTIVPPKSGNRGPIRPRAMFQHTLICHITWLLSSSWLTRHSYSLISSLAVSPFGMTTPTDDRRVDFSDGFSLSSGTVAIDCDRGLVLLLYHRSKREYLLPKGRKNVGETLQAAAERESWEESGYSCRLLRHSLPTRAPQPTKAPHTGPIAVQQRISQGIRKIIS